MNKGIIYIMTTVVPGLIKIGKTGSSNFEQRMYDLENNGYRNVTGLKRSFAIEVDNYSEKEAMLHEIFEKSQVSDMESFALDVNVVTQLLSSFEGTVVYPKTETKEDIFDDAVDNQKGKIIPNGNYTFERKKASDNNKLVKATATIINGKWTLKKGSILGLVEDVGVTQKAKKHRLNMQIDKNGKLLEDAELGDCSPSLAAVVVLYQSNNGWVNWKDKDGNSVDIYRKNNEKTT